MTTVGVFSYELNIRRRNSTFHDKNCDNIQALLERGVNTWSAFFFCSGSPTKSYYSNRAVPSRVQTLYYPEHMKEYEESSLRYKLAFHFNIRQITYLYHITYNSITTPGLLSNWIQNNSDIRSIAWRHQRPPLVVICAVFLLKKMLKPEPEKSNYSSSVFCPFVDQPPPLLNPPPL